MFLKFFTAGCLMLAAVFFSANANALVWDVGDVPVGDTATLTITVQVDAGTSGDTILNEVTNTQDQSDTNVTADDQSETIVVNNDLDLFVGKTVDDNTPDEGQIVAYTITITNNGPARATNVNLNDALPAGLTFVSEVLGAGLTGSYPNYTLASLDDGSTTTVTLNAVVDAGTSSDSITNLVTITALDQSDTNVTLDDPSETITVNNDIDLVIAKTVDNNTPDEGSTVNFTISVTNNGPAQATAISLNDTLPAGLTFASETLGAGVAGAYPNYTIATLDSTSVTTIQIAAVVDAGTSGDSLTNLVTVTALDQSDTNVTLDDPSETVIVNNDLDLETDKSVDNSTPAEGDNVVFTLTFTNNGPAQATNLNVTESLPTGLTFVSEVLGTGVTGAFPNYGIATLNSGSTTTVDITASVDAGTGSQTLTNLIAYTLDQSDTVLTNNDVSESVIVANNADVVLTKVADVATAEEGQTVTFTVNVLNNGPAQLSTVEVTDVLPAGLTLVSAVPTNGTWTDPLWAIPTIANGASESLVITATVDAGTGGQTITNIASVTQDQTDTNTTLDDPSASIVIENDADIVVTKVASDNTPDEGDTITFTITVTNNGAAQASSLTITDLLPAGLTLINATATSGTVTP